MTEPLTCPLCAADLSHVPRPDGSGNYSLVIGVQVPGVDPEVLFWRCPSCGGTWHRWPEGHPLYRKAVPYVSGGAGRA